MEIPYQKLKADVLQAIIEEFVLREGTDYGHTDYNLDQRAAQVLRQLEKGQIGVFFDEESQSCTLVTRADD